MKKILFLFIILVIGALVLYRMDIKPPVKEVVKDVSVNPSGNSAQNKNAPK